MFSKMGSRTFLFVVVMITLMLALFSQSASAIIEGDLELLKLVANGNKANLTKIKTWQGKAIVSYEGPYLKKGETCRRKSSVEFLFDADRDAVRWYWNELERQITRKDMQPVNEKPYFTSGIVKNKNLYVLFPVPPTPERPQGFVIIKPASSPIRCWNDEFHPMYFFESMEGYWHKRLMFYYEKANDPNIGNGKVRKKANIIFFEMVSTGKPAIVTYYEFDLSKSCCITKYINKHTDSIIPTSS